jgi:hypothetical protein
VIGLAPVQVPLLTETVLPSFGVPEGSGCLLFAGALPRLATTAVGIDSACAVPAAFVAVTFTLIV